MNNRQTHYFDHKKFHSLFSLTGMTQGEFGKRVGVSGSSICQYINGHNAPCEKTINKMCIVLGCSYGDLKKSRAKTVVKAANQALMQITFDPEQYKKEYQASLDESEARSSAVKKLETVKALVAVANDDNAAVIMRAIKELMK